RTRARCEPRRSERWRGDGGLLPGGKRFQAAVPAPDLAVSAQRVASDLRAGQPGSDGEVGERQAISDQPVAAAQVSVQYLRDGLELLLAARDLLRIRPAAAEAALHEVLVDQRTAGALPVGELPALPPADVGLVPRIGRPQPRLRLLRGEVLHDGVRFPEHEAVVLEDGHLAVGVEHGELRLHVIAVEQVHERQLGLDSHVMHDRHDLEGARRRRGDRQLHLDPRRGLEGAGSGRRVAGEHRVPALGVAGALLVGGGARALPAAMFEVDAGPVALGAESYLDLRRAVPLRRLPGDHDPGRWRAGGDLADLVLLAVGEALEEPATLPSLEMDLVGAFAPEGEPLLQRPPLPDVLREDAERIPDRAFHVDGLPDRHSRSSCSAKTLKACKAWSQSSLTRSR